MHSDSDNSEFEDSEEQASRDYQPVDQKARNELSKNGQKRDIIDNLEHILVSEDKGLSSKEKIRNKKIRSVMFNSKY
jgi:hypothetical protein